MGEVRKTVTVYANYYYPEVASVAQLYTDLCRGLAEKANVTVICAIPCYTGETEEKYRGKAYYFEEYDGVKVVRVKVPSYRKDKKISRIKHVLSYFFRAIFATFSTPKADVVLAVSQPPVLGGLLGRMGKFINRLRGKKTKFIYNVQDFNPEQIMATGYTKNKLLLQFLYFLDRQNCKKADRAIVVGRDMLQTMQARFTDKKGNVKHMPNTAVINNWMDEREVFPLSPEDESVLAFKRKYSLQNKFVVMYSGNIGLFYGLEEFFACILPLKEHNDIVFAFVGEGALKEKLQRYVQEQGMANVKFIPYQTKKNLNASLNAANVHLVINAQGIKGVSVPSKLYGVMAAGKPVLGILEEGSEAKMIVEQAGCGKVFAPNRYNEVAALLLEMFTKRQELSGMGMLGRAYLEKNLTKAQSIEKYIKIIQEC